MANQFNLLRYKELLELEKNNKVTFLDLELLTYKASIESQICYNRKENYFSLIEKYLKGKLAGHDFRSKFLKMETSDRKTAYTIKRNFQLAKLFSAVSNNNLSYEKLIYRSFKNLAGIIRLGILLIFYNISNINLIEF